MNPADAILAILADEYDRNPAFRESLLSELVSPDHTAESVSPTAESRGITVRTPSLSPDARRLAPIREAARCGGES